MDNIFITDDNIVKIPVVMVKGKNNNLYVAETEKELQEKNNGNVDIDWTKVENYEVVCKYPSFANSNTIASNSVTIVDGKVSINVALLRYFKIRTLLKKWNFKDNEGKEIPVNIDQIERLHPVLAGYIGDRLDEMTQ